MSKIDRIRGPTGHIVGTLLFYYLICSYSRASSAVHLKCPAEVSYAEKHSPDLGGQGTQASPAAFQLCSTAHIARSVMIFPLGRRDTVIRLCSPFHITGSSSPSFRPATFYALLYARITHFNWILNISSTVSAPLPQFAPLVVKFLLLSGPNELPVSEVNYHLAARSPATQIRLSLP
ncbi:hypothetical protein FB451DRAFT_1375645 [Mycena latifolia]|nr:hypothetical protein FB451DRAFT_1375645 [Mycena latifolia]